MKRSVRLWSHVYILIMLVGFYQSTKGQASLIPPAPENRVRIQATKTIGPIQIDGRLDEASWQQCPIATNFSVSYPNQGDDPTNRTEVRVLYDKTTLYISAICHQPGGKKNLRIVDLRRDFIYSDNEHFLVIINAFRDVRMPAQSFWVTPYGNQTDMMIYNDDVIYDYDYDAVWKAKCSIQDSSWIAEVAIPFSTIRYPADSTMWSMNFTRNNKYIGEFSGWSIWPAANSPAKMAYAGLVTDLHPPDPTINMRLQPYSLINASKLNNASTRFKPQIGGDIKWAINTNAVLDATINTDFAQADVDRQVVNLNRSNFFFPEKRQFFLENAKLFSVGADGIIQPFITRRIGLNDFGQPIPIHAGLRFISQSPKQSAGAIIIKQDGDSITAPAWFAIGRYQRNVGRKFQFGAMYAAKYDEGFKSERSSFKPVSVIDGLWKFSPLFYARAMVSHYTNTGTEVNGMATLTELSYTSNKFIGTFFFTTASKNYSPETGYTARRDFIHTQPVLMLFLRRKWLPKSIARISPRITADIFHTASNGKFQEATLTLIPSYIYFINNMRASLNIISSWQDLSTTFSPVPSVVINPGKYHYIRCEIYCRSNQTLKISTDSRVSTGRYYNGYLDSYTLSVKYAPFPKLSVIVGYTRNKFKNVGTADSTITTHLVAPELKIAFTPEIQLSCFYQYNTVIKRGAANVRFSWQYKPLSNIFLVYNDLRSIHDPSLPVPLKQQTAILKVSYVHQI